MSRKKTSRRGAKQKQKFNPALLWVGLGIALVVFSGILLSRPGNPATAGKLPREISVSQALTKRNEGAFILDVRQPEEWNQVHIPGATLIPLGELASRVNEVPRDQQVVVVCHSGNRSAQGRDILLSAGFTQVTSMAGGLTQWEAAGYPTVRGP